MELGTTVAQRAAAEQNNVSKNASTESSACPAALYLENTITAPVTTARVVCTTIRVPNEAKFYQF